ncbi:dehydrogenase/reductase SDR family member 7B-like [Pollicipes pollicipes]|uniref:dehydrogenase/reductase SDR family member 7B-like n=1 Tax=Pollicipes pollicipes TaxID=41117 RepID=UPI0018854D30|nr:dehydrogenase/reductase SDR family member 7B-like [Pollicipes pollicipes]
MVRVNMLGAVRAARAALPALTESGGRLLVVSSTCAMIPCQEVAVYAATKAAGMALVAGMRLEVRRRGVHVALITPGDMAAHTNILARQACDVDEMWRAMSAATRRADAAPFATFSAQFEGHYTALEAGTLLWLALAWLLPAALRERLVLARVHYALHRLDADWLDLNNII